MPRRHVTAKLPEEPVGAPTEAADEYIKPSPHLTPKQRRAYELFMALRGKIKFDIDLDELRGRNRH